MQPIADERNEEPDTGGHAPNDPHDPADCDSDQHSNENAIRQAVVNAVQIAYQKPGDYIKVWQERQYKDDEQDAP